MCNVMEYTPHSGPLRDARTGVAAANWTKYCIIMICSVRKKYRGENSILTLTLVEVYKQRATTL